MKVLFDRFLVTRISLLYFTVHSTRIPHFPQNSEENLSFARKPVEDII